MHFNTPENKKQVLNQALQRAVMMHAIHKKPTSLGSLSISAVEHFLQQIFLHKYRIRRKVREMMLNGTGTE